MDMDNMRQYRKMLVVILFFLVLLICGGLVWLLILPEKIPLPAQPSDLFERYVLSPIPDSVTEIKANQTQAVLGYGFTFRFKISKEDLNLIVNSRLYKRATRMEYKDGIIMCNWDPTFGDMTSGLTTYVYPPSLHKPAWFELETWDNPEAYAIYEVKEYQRNMWILAYNEDAGEAYFIVSSGRD